MSKKLQADPIELHMTSDHLRVAAGEHNTGTARHRDDFTDAVSRWRGASSLVALQEVAARWEAQHAERQQRVDVLARQVTHAANTYTATDDRSSEVIGSVPVIGNNAGGGPDVPLSL